MKKMLSIAAVTALATSSFAASDLAGAFKEGKASGQIRAMYIGTSFKDDAHEANSIYNRSGLALGGKLAYETASLYGISAGAAFYTTNDMGSKNNDANKVDGSLYDEASKSYSILGQAYVVGTFGKTTVKLGRQQIDTPLAGSDDIRMVPNLFEAALVINGDLPDTTLIGGYVSRMAGWDSASDKPSRTQFQSMSRSALNGLADTSVSHKAVDDKGVYVAAIVNSSIKDLTLQAWEYYAADVVNAVYLQADYKLGLGKDMAINLAGQFYNMQGIGATKNLLQDLSVGKIAYNVYGAKASVDTPLGLTPYVAYNKVSEQKDNGGGTFVFGAWGGYPEFAVSEETWMNSFGSTTASSVARVGANGGMNGGQTWKIGADYNLEKLGLGANTIGLSYTSFDLKDKYNNNQDNDTTVWNLVMGSTGAIMKNLDTKFVIEGRNSQNKSLDSKVVKAALNYNF